MTVYVFRCPKCDNVFDMSIPMHDYAVMSKGKIKYKCPSCESLVNPKRVIGSTPVIYKGTGFYSTDSRDGTGDP